MLWFLLKSMPLNASNRLQISASLLPQVRVYAIKNVNRSVVVPITVEGFSVLQNFDGHGLTLVLMDLSSLHYKLYPYPSVYRTLSCLLHSPCPHNAGMTTSTPYITQQGLEDRFGREFLLRVTDQPVLVKLTRARSIVPSVMPPSWLIPTWASATLPVPFVPGALERVAADLVRYFLYSSQPGEEVTKRYDDGVKWLKDVANGVVSLGLPVETPASSTGKVVMSGPRKFTRRSMRDY
jgi:phage gp36-like protein